MFAIPFWIANGLAFWPDMPIQIGAAFAVFLAFAGLFALGAMGGGDVKMIGAVMLWIPLPVLLPTLMVLAIAGGLLSGALLIVQIGNAYSLERVCKDVWILFVVVSVKKKKNIKYL